MRWLIGLPYLVVWLYLVVLLGRVVLDWIQVFAREWRPRGVMLVIAETVYTLTDPPIRFFRRIIPPVRVGSVQLDLGFLVLFFTLSLLLIVLPTG
jgi:YggT family protein